MTAPSPFGAAAVQQAADPAPGIPLPVDPLPFPAPGWGPEQARAAVAEAALALPELSAAAVLVRAVSTVVFRVGESAVKVHPPGTDPGHLARVHAVLAACPVVLAPTEPPVVTSHGVVTVTPWVPASPPLGWRTVGRVLRALHDLTTAVDLPPWTPLRRLPAQLDHLPAPYARILRDHRELLLERLDRLVPVLPAGAVHGDVSPENVLRTATGGRWIYLDFASARPARVRRGGRRAAVRRRRAHGPRLPRLRRGVRRGPARLAGPVGARRVVRPVRDRLSLWTDRAAQRDSPWLADELGRLSRVPAAR